MELSIIIVNYNTCNLLLKCVGSILKSVRHVKLNYEIIVVDNGSKESIKYQVSSPPAGRAGIKYQNLKIISNKENVGFGRANNQGARIAQGKYLLFLNTDTEVLDQGVWKLYQYIKNNPQVSAAGGKLYNTDNTPQASCGPFYTLPVVFASLFLKGDKIGLTRFSPADIKEVDWVSGACFIIRKEDFLGLGGFDEKIFMYMEEVDLFYRAKQKGWKIYFYPDARFIHLGAAASKKMTDPILNIYQGLLYFYKKHKTGLEIEILKIILKAKALVSLAIGRMINNSYLRETYGKAYKMACRV